MTETTDIPSKPNSMETARNSFDVLIGVAYHADGTYSLTFDVDDWDSATYPHLAIDAARQLLSEMSVDDAIASCLLNVSRLKFCAAD